MFGRRRVFCFAPTLKDPRVLELLAKSRAAPPGPHYWGNRTTAARPFNYGREAFLSLSCSPIIGGWGTVNWGDFGIVSIQSLKVIGEKAGAVFVTCHKFDVRALSFAPCGENNNPNE